MKAYYDSKPSTLEAVGNGSYLYNFNITEEAREASVDDTGQHTTQWVCDEVTVWPPITSNRITKAAINEQWPSDYEQKLVNEYNAAMMGLYDDGAAEAKKEAYRDFLMQRQALKEQVDKDCKELNITI